MTRDEVEAIAVSLPAVTRVVQWGESNVYKVGGKVFAMCHPSGGLSFKVTEIGFVVLTEAGAPGRQAPYCAKGQWVNVPIEDLDAADARDWLGTAHSLIAAKLTRKTRAELGLS
ncbi:MAG: MmcQ/YjbR family DNA-binding protein [Alphaproteobacteria bacterium]|nr:MmcQ/YjbR family DNA-binding protein [Alphaproteobacteria bacterium]